MMKIKMKIKMKAKMKIKKFFVHYDIMVLSKIRNWFNKSVNLLNY